ncbi:glycosyltransferase family 2 protein [Limosilactobacillus reuteri]|uniref:glycosyltransferase family 2 protein n=1 Tax=Limosilactobacillus reuteri TaxID=1598 RepID=UPI000A1EBFB3|nr:glycosyltransferase family 2 protein [Limosilactobacillus reuteri]
MNDILTIIIPCFNEQEVLPETRKEVGKILNDLIDGEKVSAKSKILFVDDGSSDNTWTLIEDYSKHYSYVTGITFTRNYGHQNALLAGLSIASKYSDIMITIDADLQDDVNAMYEMIDKYHQGNEIVYGVRSSRETDTFFKKNTALAFYALMRKLGVQLVPNSADYRLMSKKAVLALLEYKERNLFLRGMVPLIGYQSAKVFYKRKKRFAGKSKYPLKKMIHFAFDGITSFSTTPIKLIMNLGILVIIVSIVLMIYTLVQKFSGGTTSGWSSLMISIWLLGGVQLLSLSVLGEYIGKIFTEVKMRPRFHIRYENYSKKMKF